MARRNAAKILFGIATGLALLSLVLAALAPSGPSKSPFWSNALGIGLIAGVGSLAFAFAAALAGLRSRGEGEPPPNGPLCETCGYNLTGNTSGVCPECGKRIQAHPRE